MVQSVDEDKRAKQVAAMSELIDNCAGAYLKDGQNAFVADCPYCEGKDAVMIRVVGMHRGQPTIRGKCGSCKWSAMT